MRIIQSIQNKIYEVRGHRVMLDFDLAVLYDVATKVLNQAVRRNLRRFPEDFMFRLTSDEWNRLRSQFVTTYGKTDSEGWSQIVTTSESSMRSHSVTTSQNSRRNDTAPYAFTEQGVAMLSGILNSDRAISMNIAIMRAFVELRKVLMEHSDIKEQLRILQSRIGEHDSQLSGIYDAIENLLDEKAAQRKWEDRERIGFKK